MSPRHAAKRSSMSPRHAAAVRRHPLLRSTALVTVSILAFGITGMATAYARLQGNIDGVDVTGLLGTDRPTPASDADPSDPNKGVAVNILVLGSDTREGQSAIAADNVDGQRSDTSIVVHISADRTRMEMVSIPRDSLVEIPSCLRSDGSTSWAQSSAMFNSAFALGGENGVTADAAACTQKTVESLTGVYINDFVVVNMTGFVQMIDALGGVPMCIEQDIVSSKADLDLSAGMQTLDGLTALGYARARSGAGLNGSDTARIGRQQELIAATAREVMATNLLTDAPKLLRFLNAATSSLTISSGMSSIADLTGLAYSIRGIDRGSITLMTIPYATAPTDPNRVVWTSAADPIWANMAADQPIVTTTPAPTAEPSSTSSAAGTATSSPSSEQTDAPKPGVDPFTADDVTSVCG